MMLSSIRKDNKWRTMRYGTIKIDFPDYEEDEETMSDVGMYGDL